MFCSAYSQGYYSISKATPVKYFGNHEVLCPRTRLLFTIFFSSFHSFKNKFVEYLLVKSNKSDKFCSESLKSTVVAERRATTCFLGDCREICSSGRIPAGEWFSLTRGCCRDTYQPTSTASIQQIPTEHFVPGPVLPTVRHKFSKKTHMVFAYMEFKPYICSQCFQTQAFYLDS